jgi:hypothetical protein
MASEFVVLAVGSECASRRNRGVDRRPGPVRPPHAWTRGHVEGNMNEQVLPAERRSADHAIRVLKEIAPTVSVLYAEFVRFQDGDRSAAGRAGELLETLRSQVRDLDEVTGRLGVS